jgi:two-component system OmpR family response regulator
MPVSADTLRVLLVDDDAEIRALLLDYLRCHGMAVEAVENGARLRDRLPSGRVDVLLLDLMLPDEDGLTLCQWSKQVHPALPVIMLTAQGDPMSRVLGLELGADDYLPKPFEPRELVARIKAVLRRGAAVAARSLAGKARFGSWTFDRLRHELLDRDGTVLALSSAEYRLLSAFVEHPGRVLSRERLLELTRAPGVAVSDRSIDLAVSRLRGKLGDTAQERPLIRTLRGEGYLFDTEVRS